MGNVDILYNAVDSYESQAILVLIIAGVIFIPLVIWMLHSIFKKPTSRTVGKAVEKDRSSAFLCFGLYVVVVILFSGHAAGSAKRAGVLLQANDFEIVEGEFIGLTMTGKTHYFSVGGVKFDYAPNGNLNPGRFDNNCKRKGCMLRKGMNLRILYKNGEILQVELLN